MKSEKEGMFSMREYFRAKGMSRPTWIWGTPYYPRLDKIRKNSGMEPLLSDDSDEYLSDPERNSDSDAHSHLGKKSKGVEGKKLGVDPSLGKDNELFGVEKK